MVTLELAKPKTAHTILDEDKWFHDLDIFKKRNDYTQETVDRIMNHNEVTNKIIHEKLKEVGQLSEQI